MTMNSTVIALCLLCLVLGPVLAKRALCETGKKKYSEIKGGCVRCKCRRGYQQTVNVDIPYDEKLGALECPNCTRCDPGYYSNRQTGSVCVECSTPCDELNRFTDVPCDGRQNSRCGKCKDGYFEWLKGAVSCTPCTDNSDKTDCVNQTAYSTASPASSVTESGSGHSKGTDKIQISTPGWSPPHASRSGMTLVILCVVIVVLSILVLFAVYKVVNKCCNSPGGNNQHFGSRSTCTTGSSGSLLKDGVANDLEMDAELPVCEDVDNTERMPLGGLSEDEIDKMKSTVVKRDGRLLRTIATKIDRDPTSAFIYLGIGHNVIFQEGKNQEIHKLTVAEYYLSVLKKWVEKNDKGARKSVLYAAFWNAKLYPVCECISREDES